MRPGFGSIARFAAMAVAFACADDPAGPQPRTLARLVLTPDSIVLPVGSSRQFEVSALMSDGSPAGVAADFAATGGTISASGLYTAGFTLGSYRLVATERGGVLADTSVITVTDPPVLTAIVLSPDSVSLTAGASQYFSVIGQLSDGSTNTPTVTYEASGGTISSSGHYSARLDAGSFRVIATSEGGLADTGVVTVAVPANRWFPAASLLTPRDYGAAGVVDGVLYTLGGESSTFLGSVEAFDPTTNSWSARAPMPTARAGLAVGVVDGILYAVGGFDYESVGGFWYPRYLGTVEAYDPATDSWTTKSPMPTARSDLAVGVIDGILYAFGGEFWDMLATVEAYDPDTDTWTTKAPLPTPRGYFGGGVVDGLFHAIGGWNGTGYQAAVDTYDPTTDNWSSGAILIARLSPAVSVLDGVLYVMGGESSGHFLTWVEAYNPATGIRTVKTSMPLARAFFSAGTVDGFVFAIGGWDGAAPTARVDAFRP